MSRNFSVLKLLLICLVLHLTPAFGNVGNSHSSSVTRKTTLDGVDVTSLVADIQGKILKVRKPLKVYHWFQKNSDPKWNSQLSATDPVGFQYVQSSSRVYFKDFGSASDSNTFGNGLYFALDPVVTREYGGDDWVLVELELPAGLSILDATHESELLSKDSQASLQSLDCGNISSLSEIMRASSVLSKKCLGSLGKLLQNEVKFSAFLYPYRSAVLDGCQFKLNEHDLRESALVVTDATSLAPGMVKVLTAKTRDAKETRTFIQSLFYKVDHDGTLPQNRPKASQILNQLKLRMLSEKYPGFSWAGMEMDCSKSPCQQLDKVCAIKNGTISCQLVPTPDLPVVPLPNLMSRNSLPLSFNAYWPATDLLWPDMEGQPLAPHLDERVRENILGCGAGQL